MRASTQVAAELHGIGARASSPQGTVRKDANGERVSTPRTTDVIIIGLGAMGSAAAYHLARRGSRVIGLEQFTPAHEWGSSHGKSRIIREAYFEHPAYVPLVQRAYELWQELQQEAGIPLLLPTRGLMIGPSEGELVRGALASAKAHDLPHELLTREDVQHRFPVFRLEPGMVAVLEPRAGVLFPEACVQAHLSAATRAGAELRFEEPVRNWRAMADRVEVTTTRQTLVADHLIVTAGPWTSQLLDKVSIPLVVERNVQFWFRPIRDVADFAPGKLPVHIWEYSPGAFSYGFPALGPEGVKVARHHSGEICTPQTLRRSVSTQEVEAMRGLLTRYLPGASGDPLGAVVCMYTNTPDGHFVVDHHPSTRRVVLACGFSGHGFKFASVIGETLADLTREGRTAHPLELFKIRRFR